MNDNQLLRYNRQIMLPDIDIAGQEKLLAARVVIVGLGGLGCPAALYLAAAGVGELVLVDHDNVDASNLQRQIAHVEASVGQAKVESAAERIRALNSDTHLQLYTQAWTQDMADHYLPSTTLVLDCTDNLTVRLQLNRQCREQGVALVSGAAIGFEGQVAVFDFRNQARPCYQCLYPTDTGVTLSCAENGVLSPLVGVIGAMQALEAVKLIAGVGESLAGRIQILDAKYMQWRQLQLTPREDCPVCGVLK